MVDDTIKRQRIVECVHNASHLGINRTLDMVSARYYWPGLTTDVKNYVSNMCHCLLSSYGPN